MTVSQNRIKVWTPVLFWVFQFFVHIIRNIYRLSEIPFSRILNPVIITYPLDIVTFSLFYFWFAPRFFKREKLRLMIVLTIIWLVGYSFMWVLVYYLNGTDAETLPAIYFSSMGHTFLYGFYGVIIRMAIDWFHQREGQRELEKQNIKTELSLLRSQINPHFLFNTLNNIHSFSINEPHKSSYSIIKLSEIMRYMLYETRDEKVLLTKEIEYLNNYLELQRIRYDNRDFIDYRVGQIPVNMFVIPMLFIPFVENAFKHGKKSDESQISIRISCNADQVNFSCKNMKRKVTETEKSVARGIGIENVKRRLELAYQGNYMLDITDNENEYHVNLQVGILKN